MKALRGANNFQNLIVSLFLFITELVDSFQNCGVRIMNASGNSGFEQEKAAYWAMREQLLQQYSGKWVAIVGGRVVAFGEKKMAVLKQAFAHTHSTVGYINRVGYEETTKHKRIRQVSMGKYNEQYDPLLPIITGIVIAPTGQKQKPIDFIVDTGADLTVLQSTVADELGLWNFGWDEAEVAGIGAVSQQRTLYLVNIRLNSQQLPITVDCRPDLTEDILGRDVINEFELTVCAKRGLVRFEWVPDAI
ncbi:MAG: DUF5678 domain-containing protein [bacterium]